MLPSNGWNHEASCLISSGFPNAVIEPSAIAFGPDTLQVSEVSLSGDGCQTGAGNTFEAEILSVLSAGEISYTVNLGVLELRAGKAVLRLEGTFEGPG